MTTRIVTHDDVTGACELAELVPYPVVTSADSTVTVIPTVDAATGQTTFDLSAAVDINVDAFSFDPATNDLTITETDGTTYTVNLAALVDASSTLTQTVVAGNVIATHDDGLGNTTDILETVTTLVDNGDSTFTFTSEDGSQSVVGVCDLVSNLAVSATPIGG